jgi:hypothetical protein
LMRRSDPSERGVDSPIAWPDLHPEPTTNLGSRTNPSRRSGSPARGRVKHIPIGADTNEVVDPGPSSNERLTPAVAGLIAAIIVVGVRRTGFALSSDELHHNHRRPCFGSDRRLQISLTTPELGTRPNVPIPPGSKSDPLPAIRNTLGRLRVGPFGVTIQCRRPTTSTR